MLLTDDEGNDTGQVVAQLHVDRLDEVPYLDGVQCGHTVQERETDKNQRNETYSERKTHGNT